MNRFRVLGLAVALMAGMPLAASAAAVVCKSSNLAELRVTTVDPGLVGGVCLTGQGNFNPADSVSALAGAGVTGAVHLDKDESGDPLTNPNETWLNGFTNTTSGNWSVSNSAWNTYGRLFLGFHFGERGPGVNAANPDWFIVELARADLSGTWSLGGTGALLNGLSHIDLIGAGTPPCTSNCGGGGGDLPEPASLALAGLALAGAGWASRRRKA